MVNESILGGLRIAVSHKSTLKEAMQSFYNAGYKKEEIEEAAKIVFAEQQKMTKQKPQIKQTTSTDIPKKTSKKIGLIIMLAILIITLVGGLVALFIFKDKIF